MTLAAQVGGEPHQRPACPSGKLGFDSPSEARWYLGRRQGLPSTAQIYPCNQGCGQYHASRLSRTEWKRVLKGTRRRHGLTGTPSPRQPE